jgi:alpha-D-ribose 1-methylphosphonate 5-triphosphate synthase subunit PhnI
MHAVQLEFQIENASSVDEKIDVAYKQIEQIRKSNDNVRRGLFARHGELAKMYLRQQAEIDELKRMIREMNHEKTEWNYSENGHLFALREA